MFLCCVNTFQIRLPVALFVSSFCRIAVWSNLSTLTRVEGAIKCVPHVHTDVKNVFPAQIYLYQGTLIQKKYISFVIMFYLINSIGDKSSFLRSNSNMSFHFKITFRQFPVLLICLYIIPEFLISKFLTQVLLIIIESFYFSFWKGVFLGILQSIDCFYINWCHNIE